MEKMQLNNQKLKDAIKKMKEEKTQQSQSIMLGEMMNAKFMNPTTLNVKPDENGKVNIPVGTQVSFYTIISTDKKKFALAFTDEQEFNKWIEINIKNGADPKTLTRNSAIMGFMDYAEIVLNSNSDLEGFVINPYSENIIFNKEQVASLKEQRINKEKYGITKNTIKKDEQVGLRKLNEEEFPAELVNELINYMRDEEKIKLASILKMKKDDKESYLLVVDFDGEMNLVLGGIAKAVRQYLVPPMSLDIVPSNSPLGKAAMENSQIIYNKSGLQLFSKAKNVEKSNLVENAIVYIKDFFAENYDGHDVYHTLRVYNLADKIAQEEGADLEIVRLAALLHDVDDRKLVGKRKNPLENAKNFLTVNNVDEQTIEKICNIISQISFKGTGTQVPDSLEGKVVQDADRLDAIGAIGIYRTLYYSAFHKIPMHNPESEYRENISEEEYYSNDTTAINHFYEKLLKLKSLMNTQTAIKIAESRHKYMENYLQEFYDEWDGRK